MVESTYEKVKSADVPILVSKNVNYNKSSKHNGLNNVSFEIRRGEIYGVAGVDGNGQSELAALVTGLIQPDDGELDLKGLHVGLFDPGNFIAQNVSHIPEDRNKMGLVCDMTIKENLILKAETSPEFSQLHGWKLDQKAIKNHSNKMRIKYDIRCRTTDQLVSQLSGGNQQKVILAREMERKPDLLIAVHPIRGLDIGAAQFIHDQLIQARDAGCAILLISTDLAEVLLISDRISVMYEGRMIGEFDGANPPMDKIALALSGQQ
jgi:simple sugar transport system ATP-binding protein